MRTSFILGLLLALMMPHAARAGCVVDKKAMVSLLFSNGTIMVPLNVNGMAAIFIVDTGAQRSVVTEEAVQRLGLARDQWVGTTLRGVGGIERRPNADPRSLSLGGIPLFRRTLTHDNSLTVGVLPRSHVGNLAIDGLLGRDFLSLFDLDLDVPSRRLTLYQVNDCAGRFLPWTSDYASIPVTVSAADTVTVPVSIDGVKLLAILDTGASASLVAAPGIYRLGLTATDLAGDPTDQISGLGSRVITAHRHRFRSIQMGNQIIESPMLWVEPVRTVPFADMLLGADWLAGRRVWISFATKQLFKMMP